MPTALPYILIVDDVPDAADSQAELLRLWGYDAQPLYSGIAALDAARVRRPDIVLLDLGMNGMSGLQLTLQIRELPGCETVPIVAISHRRNTSIAQLIGRAVAELLRNEIEAEGWSVSIQHI